MFDANTGLLAGFLLLAAATSYNVVYSRGHYVFRALVICILLWYGLAVYFTVPKLKGWSIDANLPPNAKIIDVKIIENECFYFWLNENPQYDKELLNLLRVDRVFAYSGKEQPRSYRIPYDRELHKKLLEARRAQKKINGSLLMTGKKGIKKKGKKGKKDLYKDDSPFKVLNPFDMIPKDNMFPME